MLPSLRVCPCVSPPRTSCKQQGGKEHPEPGQRPPDRSIPAAGSGTSPHPGPGSASAGTGCPVPQGRCTPAQALLQQSPASWVSPPSTPNFSLSYFADVKVPQLHSHWPGSKGQSCQHISSACWELPSSWLRSRRHKPCTGQSSHTTAWLSPALCSSSPQPQGTHAGSPTNMLATPKQHPEPQLLLVSPPKEPRTTNASPGPNKTQQHTAMTSTSELRSPSCPKHVDTESHREGGRTP